MSSEKYIVLITGGNSGIGFETAVALGASSAHHVILGARSLSKGHIALADLQSRSDLKATFSVQQLDITSPSSLANAADAIAVAHGRLDCLVQNAGIAPLTGGLAEQMRAAFDTNALGAALALEAFTPLLLKGKDARVVYTSSCLGSVALRNDPKDAFYGAPMAPYRVSKAAENMVVACARFELEPQGVKVLAFDPGFVVTNLQGDPEIMRGMGAGDASVSGRGLAALVKGERDAEVGQLLSVEGVQPW